MLLIPRYTSFPIAQSARCLYVKLAYALLALSPPSRHTPALIVRGWLSLPA